MSEHSYQFNQIFVTKPHEPTKLSDTTTLTFDKKDVYAGGKYRIKLKHLNALEQSITERDDYGDNISGVRGGSSRGHGRGGYHHGDATTTKTLLLVLRSKHIEIQCSTNMGGTAKAVQTLETFISGLKSAHRKQKIKHEETDPYAEEEKKKHNRISIGGGGSSKGGYRSTTSLSLGGGGMHRGNNSRAALRTTQVTPAGVYMSSDRKRPTSGAFQSPAKNRPRHDSSSGGGERISSGNYAHYDPALEEEDDEEEDEVVGNVVVKEPVTKALFLPPKSPRNATPTKLRDEKEGNSNKVRTIANQLQGISGGNIKLKKKVDMEYSDTEYDDAVDRKRSNQKSLSTFKRRKLQMSRMSEGDSDSDFETKKSSAKKRLHLSANDEDEEESEDEDDEEKSVSSKNDNFPKANTKVPKSKSAADEALTPSPKKTPVKKGNIASFFTAKPAASKKARPSSPTPGDTYGSSLSTPTKKPSKKNDSTAPSTLSTPPHRTEPTPVQPLSQRKGPSSRYFGNANFKVKGMATSNNGRNLFSAKDDEVEEDDIYGDTSEYYNENDENAAAIHQDEYDVYGDKPTTTYSGIMNTNSRRRGVYGRAGRTGMMAQAQLRMGRARLGPQNQNQFSSYAAGSSTGQSSKPTKNPYIIKGHSQSSADLALSSKRYDSPPPSRMSHMPDLVNNQDPPAKNIPGIQNLGNTCYLSASLQTLFSIPQFIADLYKTYDSQSLTGKKMPLTKALLEVATAIGVLSEEDAKGIDPEAARQIWLNKMAGNPVALKKQMDVLTDKFAGYEQRDAHEFLSDLVDYLHDELAAPLMPPAEETAIAQTTEASTTTKAGEGGRTSRLENKDPNEEGNEKEDKGTDHGVLPTDEFFHLNVRVCLTCDSCGYSRSKDEMYRHLSVDVGIDSDIDKCTVERSLQQFFQPEMRELKCEKCDAGKSATQTMEIISCPKALLLHFKRFIVTQEMKRSSIGGDTSGKENNKAAPPPRMEMVLRKNKAKIPLEESLSINSFVSKDEDCSSGKYHLRGVVHHIGGTAFSGHYNACAKRTLKKDDNEKSDANDSQDNEEQWVFFDDRAGTKKDMEYVTGSERNQRNCYMAVYEMR